MTIVVRVVVTICVEVEVVDTSEFVIVGMLELETPLEIEEL